MPLLSLNSQTVGAGFFQDSAISDTILPSGVRVTRPSNMFRITVSVTRSLWLAGSRERTVLMMPTTKVLSCEYAMKGIKKNKHTADKMSHLFIVILLSNR